MELEENKAANRVHGEEKLRQKKKARVLVDGGVEEEMDMD
jgi:large subunit ribosomal protein L24e